MGLVKTCFATGGMRTMMIPGLRLIFVLNQSKYTGEILVAGKILAAVLHVSMRLAIQDYGFKAVVSSFLQISLKIMHSIMGYFP